MTRLRIALLLLLGLAPATLNPVAQETNGFSPKLGQALELINDSPPGPATVPAGTPELTEFPLPTEKPRPLLTEVPGKPFRQVSPMPETRAWWKYPFYVALGLPRDAVDWVFGRLSYVPLFNLPLVWLPYEIVPTQYLVRDPRDWHGWPGTRNARGHGMIDSDSWGFYPSARSWHFMVPSKRKLRKHEEFNERLRAELRVLNRAVENENMTVLEAQRQARELALKAIEGGAGREAVGRMLPFYESGAMDEGTFALFVGALTVYAPQGPAWVKPLLWRLLGEAQPKSLVQAEKLLTDLARRGAAQQPFYAEPLIYVRLLLGNESGALNAARAAAQSPAAAGQTRSGLLQFETALTAGNAEIAAQALAALKESDFTAEQWQSMRARLALLQGDVAQARELFTRLRAERPDDAHVHYYLGCAELMAADQGGPAEGYQSALGLLERAVLLAARPTLRLRAGQALGYVRGKLSGVSDLPAEPETDLGLGNMFGTE